MEYLHGAPADGCVWAASEPNFHFLLSVSHPFGVSGMAEVLAKAPHLLMGHFGGVSPLTRLGSGIPDRNPSAVWGS
eukprot:13605608-Heterocapsa_arctica.AAC.1